MRIEASSLQGNHFTSSSSLNLRRVHKSCGDMSQCTSIGSAHASISRRVECKGTCNQGNVLESATRTQKTAYFSIVKLDLSIFQWRLPKKELKNISRQIRNLGKKQRRAAASKRHPAHNPRSLPVCVLAGHSLSAAVDIISGRGWHHARAEKL